MNPREQQRKNESYLTELTTPTLSAYSAFSVFTFVRLDKINDSTMKKRCQTYSGRATICLSAVTLQSNTGQITLWPEADHRTISHLVSSASKVGVLPEAATDFIAAKTRLLRWNEWVKKKAKLNKQDTRNRNSRTVFTSLSWDRSAIMLGDGTSTIRLRIRLTSTYTKQETIAYTCFFLVGFGVSIISLFQQKVR